MKFKKKYCVTVFRQCLHKLYDIIESTKLKGGFIMENLQHRHDITDEAWAIIEPLLLSQKGQWAEELPKIIESL